MNIRDTAEVPSTVPILRRRTIWILALVFCLASNFALVGAAVRLWSWLDPVPQLQLSLVVVLCAIAAGVRVAIQTQQVMRASPAAGRSNPCEQ